MGRIWRWRSQSYWNLVLMVKAAVLGWERAFKYSQRQDIDALSWHQKPFLVKHWGRRHVVEATQ